MARKGPSHDGGAAPTQTEVLQAMVGEWVDLLVADGLSRAQVASHAGLLPYELSVCCGSAPPPHNWTDLHLAYEVRCFVGIFREYGYEILDACSSASCIAFDQLEWASGRAFWRLASDPPSAAIARHVDLAAARSAGCALADWIRFDAFPRDAWPSGIKFSATPLSVVLDRFLASELYVHRDAGATVSWLGLLQWMLEVAEEALDVWPKEGTLSAAEAGELRSVYDAAVAVLDRRPGDLGELDDDVEDEDSHETPNEAAPQVPWTDDELRQLAIAWAPRFRVHRHELKRALARLGDDQEHAIALVRQSLAMVAIMEAANSAGTAQNDRVGSRGKAVIVCPLRDFSGGELTAWLRRATFRRMTAELAREAQIDSFMLVGDEGDVGSNESAAVTADEWSARKPKTVRRVGTLPSLAMGLESDSDEGAWDDLESRQVARMQEVAEAATALRPRERELLEVSLAFKTTRPQDLAKLTGKTPGSIRQALLRLRRELAPRIDRVVARSWRPANCAAAAEDPDIARYRAEMEKRKKANGQKDAA